MNTPIFTELFRRNICWLHIFNAIFLMKISIKKKIYPEGITLPILVRLLATLNRTFGTLSAASLRQIIRLRWGLLSNLLDDGKNLLDDLIAAQSLAQSVHAEQTGHAVQVVRVLSKMIYSDRKHVFKPWRVAGSWEGGSCWPSHRRISESVPWECS